MYCKKCGSQISDDSIFCFHCGARQTDENSTVVSTNMNADKLKTADMAEYLKMVCSLENDKYALEQTIADLNHKIRTYGIKSNNIYKPFEEKSSYEFEWWKVVLCGLIGFVIGAAIMVVNYGGSTFNHVLNALFCWLSYESWVGAIIGAIIGVVLTLITAHKEHVAVKNENEKRMNEYAKKLVDDKERVEKEKKCIPVFEQHIRELKSKIAVLQKSLNQLYSYDIIFSKYRGNIAALNTMYEYFISGRVTSLAAINGIDGAYNLYENELRQNLIIGKLDTIINSLEQIRANQYMLYVAIQDATDAVRSISDMAGKINSIESNTALTAYNTKIIADNTNVLSYLETIKFLNS